MTGVEPRITRRGDGTRGARAPSALSRLLPSSLAEHLSALLPDGGAVMKIQENSRENLAHSANPTLAVLLPLLCAATQTTYTYLRAFRENAYLF